MFAGVVEVLLRAGADTEAQTKDGRTARDMAPSASFRATLDTIIAEARNTNVRASANVRVCSSRRPRL